MIKAGTHLITIELRGGSSCLPQTPLNNIFPLGVILFVSLNVVILIMKCGIFNELRNTDFGNVRNCWEGMSYTFFSFLHLCFLSFNKKSFNLQKLNLRILRKHFIEGHMGEQSPVPS